MRPRQSIAVVLLLACGTWTPAAAQETCPLQAGARTEAGWEAYRAGNVEDAESHFRFALDLCPEERSALNGLGYVALRRGEDGSADSLFHSVLAVAPDDVDARVGAGIVAWRKGRFRDVHDHFSAVVREVPDHATAREYLARLPEGFGPPPPRPELVLPDTLAYPARTAGDGFEVRSPRGWSPFYIKGMNLGAALPGRHPSQFPDSATYAVWIERMVGMGVNTVRIYTVHPPDFYEALYDWNTGNPDRPLWLVHGVWTELPADHDFGKPEFEAAFFGEMRRVVDILHGRADVEPRPGHASGFYTVDVSPWTLAYIIGREWEPFSAVAYDSIAGGVSGFRGRYVTVDGGNAMDAWMGRAVESLVSYETETYRAQRPAAYTNWPTLDPLAHPTETTVDEEMAIRRARGETPDVRPREYDNDAISLDASRVRATEEFPAGYFASFHAYPYYPDFMILQEDYGEASSSRGTSHYFGYLRALKAHHPGIPVVISEYGVPASLGLAHLQPEGLHHGGLTETEMAAADERLTVELAEAGMAGGMVFAWMDEWFKKNWVAIEFELPEDRNRLWYNRLDAEQHYGMWAMEARPPLDGATLSDRLLGWRDIAPLYTEGDGSAIRVTHDAAYLWLLVERPGRSAADTLLVGFDMVDAAAGDFRWPGAVGDSLPVGLEFVLTVAGDEARVLVDPPQNPFRLVEVGQGADEGEVRTFGVEDPPPGLFRARVEQRFNLPYYTRPNADGVYDSLRVVVNRRRFGRDGTEYLAVGYDRGLLPPGEAPDGLWESTDDGRFVEVRIPWLLLNVTDPSSRTVLQGPGGNTRGAVEGPDGQWRLSAGNTAWPDSVTGVLGTTVVDDIGVVVEARGGSGVLRWPSASAVDAVARYRWPGWDEPRWRERPRAVVSALREVFDRMDSAGRVLVTDASGADAAWDSGDQDAARGGYEARLARDPQDDVALHRLALIHGWNEEYQESLVLFGRLLELTPDNLDAVVDRARVRAWSGDVDGAIADLDGLLERHPDHAGALESRARFEAWAGQYEASVSSYEALLAIAPDNAAARRQQAQVLSWASRFEASRTIYDSLLARDPDDVEARIGLAQVLAFADDLDGAEREYRRVLRGHPEHVGAMQGLGRTLSWAGRLVAGEEVYRAARAAAPRDVGVLVGLAQNLRWQGRTAAAGEVLEAAVALDPSNPDVREQMRWVRVSLGSQVRPGVVFEDDSDGNHMVTTSVMTGWHPTPRVGLRVDAYRRTLSQALLERRARGVVISGSYQIEPGWTVALGLGGSASDATGSSTRFSTLAVVTSPGRHAAGGTLTLSGSALDATAILVERGVTIASASMDGRWAPAPGWRVDGTVGWARFRGNEDNHRRNGAVAVARRWSRWWTVGMGVRAFAFETDLAEGYFDPDFYGIAEITGRWLREAGSWSLLFEAAPGVQQVTADGDPAATFRTSARVGYRFAPGREISVGAGYSSTGLQSFSTGESDYRYTAVILGAAWIF